MPPPVQEAKPNIIDFPHFPLVGGEVVWTTTIINIVSTFSCGQSDSLLHIRSMYFLCIYNSK